MQKLKNIYFLLTRARTLVKTILALLVFFLLLFYFRHLYVTKRKVLPAYVNKVGSFQRWASFFEAHTSFTLKEVSSVNDAVFYLHESFYFSQEEINMLKNLEDKIIMTFSGENVKQGRFYFESDLLTFVDIATGFPPDYMVPRKFNDGKKGIYLSLPYGMFTFVEPDTCYPNEQVVSRLKGYSAENFATQWLSRPYDSIHIARGRPDEIRKNMVTLFEKLVGSAVHCPGTSLNNRKEPTLTEDRVSKLKLMENYKFNICPENSKGIGYLTEKVFDSFMSGSVPLWWGGSVYSSHVSSYVYESFFDFEDAAYINPKRILHYQDLLAGNDSLILQLFFDPLIRKSFFSEPILLPHGKQWLHDKCIHIGKNIDDAIMRRKNLF